MGRYCFQGGLCRLVPRVFPRDLSLVVCGPHFHRMVLGLPELSRQLARDVLHVGAGHGAEETWGQ